MGSPPDADEYFRKSEMLVAEYLCAAVREAANVDQLLWSDLEDAVRPFIELIKPDTKKCESCGAIVSFWDWYMKQGLCQPCEDKSIAYYLSEREREGAL